MKLPCQCCGYLTIEKRGSYAICRVCFWEDDGFWDDPDDERMRRGPNHGLTLTEARAEFLAYGAVAEHVREYARKPLPEEIP